MIGTNLEQSGKLIVAGYLLDSDMTNFSMESNGEAVLVTQMTGEFAQVSSVLVDDKEVDVAPTPSFSMSKLISLLGVGQLSILLCENDVEDSAALMDMIVTKLCEKNQN